MRDVEWLQGRLLQVAHGSADPYILSARVGAARRKRRLSLRSASMESEPITLAMLRAELKGMATKADLEGLATKAELKGMATKADLEGLATKAELKAEVEALRSNMEQTFRHMYAARPHRSRPPRSGLLQSE